MSDLSKLSDEVNETIADEEKAIAGIEDLKKQLAAAQNSGDQALIDDLTAKLAAERAKVEAELNPPPPTP